MDGRQASDQSLPLWPSLPPQEIFLFPADEQTNYLPLEGRHHGCDGDEAMSSNRKRLVECERCRMRAEGRMVSFHRERISTEVEDPQGWIRAEASSPLDRIPS